MNAGLRYVFCRAFEPSSWAGVTGILHGLTMQGVVGPEWTGFAAFVTAAMAICVPHGLCEAMGLEDVTAPKVPPKASA